MLSISITDEVVTLRPFRVEDSTQLYEAVRESLTELKPWMSWAQDAYSQQSADDFIRITRAGRRKHFSRLPSRTRKAGKFLVDAV